MAAGDSGEFVLLNRLADEFAERYRSGERPTLSEYVNRHPQLADDIRAKVAGLRTLGSGAKINFALAELPDFTALPGKSLGPQHCELGRTLQGFSPLLRMDGEDEQADEYEQRAQSIMANCGG